EVRDGAEVSKIEQTASEVKVTANKFTVDAGQIDLLAKTTLNTTAGTTSMKSGPLNITSADLSFQTGAWLGTIGAVTLTACQVMLTTGVFVVNAPSIDLNGVLMNMGVAGILVPIG